MTRNFKLFVLFLSLSFSGERLVAQTAEQTPLRLTDKFQSYNSLQLLNGSSTTSVAIHSVNGFKFGKFFTGIGTGFDYYYHTSVPLFFEGRFDLVKSKKTLQVFGNAGLNFAFASDNGGERSKTGEFKPGPMYGGGIDVLFPAKSNSFMLGVAFSNKHVIQMVDNNIWNPLLNRIENVPIKEDYSLNRIALRVGWRF